MRILATRNATAAVLWTIASVLLPGTVLIAAEHTKDSLEVVKQKVAAKEALLVDVRSLSEWNDGHIAGAVLLPFNDLEKGVDSKKLKETLPVGKIVYTYCVVGMRSLKAAELLKKNGYDVRPLKPGYDDLIRAGFEKAKK